jgi:succinate-acetate transporter protein
MLIPAFVIQFAVAVFALLSRDAMAATVMGTFSGSWGVTALVLALHPPDVNQALAVFFLLFGGFAGMMAYAAIPKMALCAVLTVAVPHFVAGGLANATGSTPLDRIAGITGFVLMAVALYTAWALMLEDMRGKTILPVGRRGPARAALEGEVVDQLIGLEHAAGVRRTL